MEETPALAEAPALTDSSGMSSSPSYGYTNPISSFFNGIFFIIIMVLLLIFIVVLMFAQGVSFLATGGKSQTAPPATKEKFKDGPPYPSCKTNGALAMF